MRNERGFALVAVILILALLGILVGEFAFSMRLEAIMARAFRDQVLAVHLAEAAVQQAVQEILGGSSLAAVNQEGELRFYANPTQVRPAPARRDVPLGPGTFSYRLTDEGSRLNLNTTTPPVLDRLLRELGLEKEERDAVVASLLDWRDANDEYRLNGAESDDYYLKLPVPYRARNSNVESVYELLQIRGVTADLFYGRQGTAGLLEHTTAIGTGQVNINAAPELVLRALGLSEAEITEIVQARTGAQGPYPNVPARFSGRQLTTQASHFRVEALGLIGGQPRARITATLRRTTSADGVVRPLFLSWRVEPGIAP
jgi:general secretion pathway protein K